MEKKENKFQKWVRKNFNKTHELSAKLGIGDAAVRNWLLGKGSPRSEMVLKIAALSKGELTCEDIIKASTQNVEGG